MPEAGVPGLSLCRLHGGGWAPGPKDMDPGTSSLQSFAQDRCSKIVYSTLQELEESSQLSCRGCFKRRCERKDTECWGRNHNRFHPCLQSQLQKEARFHMSLPATCFMLVSISPVQVMSLPLFTHDGWVPLSSHFARVQVNTVCLCLLAVRRLETLSISS